MMIARMMRSMMTQRNIAHRSGCFLMLQSLSGYRDPDWHATGSCIRYDNSWKTDTTSYKFPLPFSRPFRANIPSAGNKREMKNCNADMVFAICEPSSDKSYDCALMFERFCMLCSRYFIVKWIYCEWTNNMIFLLVLKVYIYMLIFRIEGINLLCKIQISDDIYFLKTQMILHIINEYFLEESN